MKPAVVVLPTGAMRRFVLAIVGFVLSGVNVSVKFVVFPTASVPTIVWFAGVAGPLVQLYCADVYGPPAGVDTVPPVAVHLVAVNVGYVTEAGPEPLSVSASTRRKLPA